MAVCSYPLLVSLAKEEKGEGKKNGARAFFCAKAVVSYQRRGGGKGKEKIRRGGGEGKMRVCVVLGEGEENLGKKKGKEGGKSG